MKAVFTLILIFISLTVQAQDRDKAYRINKDLGRGVNFGNMLEAPYEGAWGTVWEPEYPKMIADLGFTHIRIPVYWESEARTLKNPPYTIDTDFLKRVKEVVDSTLNSGLYAIINMHHHNDLFNDPDGQKDRFLTQWKQISEYFKDYSDSLLFEILNEPNGNLTPDKWNVFLAQALDTIRVDNPERIVLIGTDPWGGVAGLENLELPEDENIILTVHYYSPFHFTHQGAGWVDGSDKWIGTTWTDTEYERQQVINDFAPLVSFEEKNKVPVHIGEFGSIDVADDASRERWTTYISRYIESKGWSWAYWSFTTSMGFYDPVTNTYDQQLVNALLHNEMPPPAVYPETVVYKSQFESSNDGWTLNAFNGASAYMTRSDATLNITISKSGTAAWNIQLLKQGIKMMNGKKYKFSFDAKASAERNIISNIGLNGSPWTSYSGYNSTSLTDTFNTYVFVFDMLEPSDDNARISIDMGLSDINVSVKNISLVILEKDTPTSTQKIKTVSSSVFPNPASSYIFINNLDNFNSYELLSPDGAVLFSGIIGPDINKTNISSLPRGIYFIRLKNNDSSHTFKILKE
jgi:aryl-phospho-beta-D-glucosidase BglC (GH1 family)/predicted secreted protein